MIQIKQISAEACWPIRHVVMWPDRELEYVKLPKDEMGLHYGLFKHNKLIAVVSCFVENHQAQFRKFACLQDEQGKGYGTKLLDFLLADLAKKPVDRIFCNARVEKAGFYERYGLKKTRHHFEKGGLYYVIMEKHKDPFMQELVDLMYADDWMMARLKEVQSCNLPDAWIGAGFIRNRVWDVKHKIIPPHPLNDIDVIFFDKVRTDREYEKEIEAILLELCPSENWSVKNQARMHQKQGHLPYKTSEEALSKWIETPTCIAARLKPETDLLEILAPHGCEDLMSMKVRPNPGLSLEQFKLYNERIREKGWAEKWPLLDILYTELN